MAKTFLRLGVWNIEGLPGKLDNPDFLSKIQNFDLIPLVETWLSYTTLFLNVTKKKKKKSLDLCIGNSLIPLNGRTKGDLIGQFTCNMYSTMGQV